MFIYRFAAAVALVLEIAERSGLHVTGVPIGGGSMQQLGAIFGAAFVATEIQETAHRFSQSVRVGICHFVRELRAFARELSALFKENGPK